MKMFEMKWGSKVIFDEEYVSCSPATVDINEGVHKVTEFLKKIIWIMECR